MTTKVMSVALLLAPALCFILAAPGPVLNGVPRTTGLHVQELSERSDIADAQVSDDDDGFDAVLQRQKRQKRTYYFNSYMRELYSNTIRLKKSNCTETLFNQTVSEYFCSNDRLVFLPLIVPDEPSDFFGSRYENYTYELCTNVTVNSDKNETILGHDFVLFKQPLTEEVRLEVYLFQVITNATEPWIDLVNTRIYTRNLSGWQVFHLESHSHPVTSPQACVNMYIRETQLSNGTALYETGRFLNRTEINEVFILDAGFDQPFATTFMSGTDEIPSYIDKRSVKESPVFAERSNAANRECVLQEHTVSLSDSFPMNIVYPQEAQLGTCVHFQRSTYRKEEPGFELDNRDEDLFECGPVGFADLPVLADIDGALTMVTIPEVIVTECDMV